MSLMFATGSPFTRGDVSEFAGGYRTEITIHRAKAKTAYQDFFTLWKDADPDIPVLKEAQSEFARLH
jgi:hypothetical protein